MSEIELLELIEALQDTLREHVVADDSGDLEAAARCAVQYLVENGVIEAVLD
jgi:hypothetical protein